jgi:hypothetical protein
MNHFLLGLVVVSPLVTGCFSADPPGSPDDPQPQDPLPLTSGSYRGTYRVPTSPELAPAATFPLEHDVDWTVANGIVTLHYDLPVGLVGGDLSVTLTGSIEGGDTSLFISGEVGTGTCAAAGTTVTCREVFTGLGVLPIDMAVVEARAATEYSGSVLDRVAVATVFSSDPIGIVDFDLSAPVIDDHGGDD